MEVLKEITKHSALGNPIRLGIMLYLLPRGKALFIELQKVLELTPGNLDSHLRALEKSGYVKIKKVIKDRPRTAVFITTEGAKKTRDYISSLRIALKKVEEEVSSP